MFPVFLVFFKKSFWGRSGAAATPGISVIGSRAQARLDLGSPFVRNGGRPGQHCTLHTAHRTLHTANSTTYTAHRTIHTALWRLKRQSAHCTLNTVNCTLQPNHWTRYTEHWWLNTVRCILQTSYCICIAHYQLHTWHIIEPCTLHYVHCTALNYSAVQCTLNWTPYTAMHTELHTALYTAQYIAPPGWVGGKPGKRT